MKNAVVTLAAAAAVLFGLTPIASAQNPPGTQGTAAQGTPRTQSSAAASGTTTMPTYELAAGYQVVRAGGVCDGCDAQTLPLGFAVDAVRNFGALGVVAEGGWARKSDDFTDLLGSGSRSLNLWHYGGGIRWTGRTNPRIWPYGQVIAGATTEHGSTSYDDATVDTTFGASATRTHFMVQPGVGVTFVSGDGWGVFGQVDYRRVFLDEAKDGGSGRNDMRVLVGLRMILD